MLNMKTAVELISYDESSSNGLHLLNVFFYQCSKQITSLISIQVLCYLADILKRKIFVLLHSAVVWF